MKFFHRNRKYLIIFDAVNMYCLTTGIFFHKSAFLDKIAFMMYPVVNMQYCNMTKDDNNDPHYNSLTACTSQEFVKKLNLRRCFG